MEKNKNYSPRNRVILAILGFAFFLVSIVVPIIVIVILVIIWIIKSLIVGIAS